MRSIGLGMNVGTLGLGLNVGTLGLVMVRCCYDAVNKCIPGCPFTIDQSKFVLPNYKSNKSVIKINRKKDWP